MNSFFGIGLPELILIAILALIVLGPERLPGALRQMAQYFRQFRALTQEVTSQFSEELKMLDEINPAKIMNEVTEPVKDLQPKKIMKDIEESAKDLQPKNIVKQMKDAVEDKPSGPAKAKAASRTPASKSASKAKTVSPETESESQAENQIMPPESSTSPSANGNKPTENKPTENSSVESTEQAEERAEEAA